ncbi:adenosine deaminase [Actinokineospora iranica]|uniref:Adenosine deaminase n=1 Tax=Actinokineospora iranica TaxID=1271860 RepID=A0A1G6IR42_9PSEU|nr:adenosine deaminase [Actinokineospora iranica]SDC08900.1 adenosine deaminase [Actinokineospora iranica]
MGDLALLPKAHLHVHLESTVRSSTLVEIGAANGIAVPPQVSHGPFRFRGFREFADQNSRVRDVLRGPEDFRRIAVEFCADEAAQGTGYAEVTFTAASHGERLGDLEMPLAAVLEGLAEGQRRHGIEVRVLLDHSRRKPVARLRRTVELASRFEGVVGVGLAGDEAYPAAPFAEVLAEAREAGLRLVHHAGECGGPESVREVITVGGAERVGHGFRVLEDPEVVAEVRDRGVPLEVCPSSNVALGLVPSLAAHPLPRLLAAGLVVTVNTDVPNVTGRGLAAEYAALRAAFGLDDSVLAGLARSSVEASFASAGTKARLLAGIGSWLG